jgi:hypothetical protein
MRYCSMRRETTSSRGMPAFSANQTSWALDRSESRKVGSTESRAFIVGCSFGRLRATRSGNSEMVWGGGVGAAGCMAEPRPPTEASASCPRWGKALTTSSHPERTQPTVSTTRRKS